MDEIGKLSNRINQVKRYHMKLELYEDYFLKFVDEGFKLTTDDNGFVRSIHLRGCVKGENIEDTFKIYIERLNTIKRRFDLIENYNDSHFRISFNGVPQCEWNPETMKNDLYVYKGIKTKYDKDGYDEMGYLKSNIPSGMVNVLIEFFIV